MEYMRRIPVVKHINKRTLHTKHYTPEIGETDSHACLVVLGGARLLLQPELLEGVADGLVALVCVKCVLNIVNTSGGL